MNILYIDTDNVWRGGQEQLFSLMSGMERRRHRVSLAAPPHSPLALKARQAGIQIYPFQQRTEFSPAAFLRLAAILRRQKFEIAHFNTPRAVLVGGLATQLCTVPVRVCSRRVNFPLRSRFSRLKYNWMQDGVLTVSLSIRQTLIDGGVRPDLITVIYEGVDVGSLDQQNSAPLFSDRKGLVVGTVAHLSHEKGHSILLDAAAKLAAQFLEVTYVVVGTGELERDLREKAKTLALADRVVFTGFRPDSEGLMKQFDVFCLPSLSEGLSSAILAAMANRLPVIATNVGGIPELVLDGETGFLVPPHDAEALYTALAQLFSSAELRRRMGDAGRRRIEARFTLERKLDESEELYTRLLQSAAFK